MQMGLLHVYMGEGKGKTTAAIGLAVRAAGAGKKVIFAQFMKGGITGEMESFDKIDNITVLRCDKQFPFYDKMTAEQKNEQKELHDKILEQLMQAVCLGSCDVIVLDEVTYPWQWELIDICKLQAMLEMAQNKVEIVCTGRQPDAWLISRADYVTEMRAIRHPFEMGIKAREGIEY